MRLYYENDLVRIINNNIYADIPTSEHMLSIILSDVNRDTLSKIADVMLQRQSKLNAICIMGDANCGKTLFAEALCDAFINVGYMRTPDKFERFAFENVINKNVIFWDDFCGLLDNRYEEPIKKMTGGTRVSLPQKNLPDRIMERTPMVITSNARYAFAHNIYRSRVVRINLRPKTLLREFNLRIHPLAIWRTLLNDNHCQ